MIGVEINASQFALVIIRNPEFRIRNRRFGRGLRGRAVLLMVNLLVAHTSFVTAPIAARHAEF
jgi:hypothetical protein